MQYIQILPLLATLASQGTAGPTTLEERQNFNCNSFTPKVVNHDSMRYLPESVRSGNPGTVITNYEPYIHIAHGCRPYPAVDQSGNVNGGLQNSGSPSGGCNDGTNQQTYVRAKMFDGRFAMMFAWYFPKDQISAGGANAGHRHDWESVVCWTDDPTGTTTPKFHGCAASGHGDYPRKTQDPRFRDGTHPQVEYYTNLPTNHELQFKSGPGRNVAMIDWEKLSPQAQCALNKHSFGKANCPFNDGNFDSNLRKAWIA
ncbi:NLP effector protein 10 [Pseudocercospora fuligena]|uniref:NLP effector protein 10 n=1 Tax=Pseudocercospora fuligena TaxID=685502 RepID=A0A8H6RCB0_9PEZI|nr:NLP effector protein 10 [Pseudocercospora fuligena]